ncbi:MAG: acyl-CoA dehydrogenase family protein [Candidatus Geothermincolia bacterium]
MKTLIDDPEASVVAATGAAHHPIPFGLDSEELFPFDEMFEGLLLFKAIDPKYLAEMRALFEKVRRFAREEAAPLALQIDRDLSRDPDNLEPIWEFVRRAGRNGLFSLLIPKVYGGAGLPLFASAMIWEELCSVCAGLGNVIGSHYLGFLPFYASMKLRLFESVCREIVAGEKTARPVVLAAAITEPLVGSDHAEVELIPGARIGCEARKVEGGYVLNGTKVFISNGSLSAYHVVIMPTDRRRPLETFTSFLVPTDTPGFSFGRDDRKVGQKACPASVLQYEDCFLPEKYRLTPVGMMGKMMDILGPTRICVGAISTGIARGAYERAASFAREQTVRGKPLINHQWAQFILAEMLMNVHTARATYMNAGFCDLVWGTGRMVPLVRGGYRLKQLSDRIMDTEIAKRVTENEALVERAYDRILNSSSIKIPLEAGYGSVAKVKCSDIAMTNAGLAMDLAGKAGLRHDAGMEKIYRDAKLVQIYEGTNEMNRLGLFHRFIGRGEPGVHVFGKEQ